MSELSTIDIINLIAPIASLILAILAISLSLYFYNKSKDAEKNSEINVGEIKTQTKSLNQLATRMLDKFTDYATKPKAVDESFLILANLYSKTVPDVGGALNSQSGATLDEARQYIVNSSILSFFYSAVANMATQGHLPENRDELEEDDGVAAILNASYEDYQTLKRNLQEFDQNLVNASAMLTVYQIALGWDNLILTVDGTYAGRDSAE